MKNFFLILSPLLVICGAYAGWQIHRFMTFQNPSAVELEILPGTSLRWLSNQLESLGVVQNRWLFEAMVRLQQEDKGIKAGEYVFSTGVYASDVLQILMRGVVKQYALTIPEGFNLAQIGALFQERFTLSEQAWRSLVTNPQVLEEFAVEGMSVEGYLFPDTYFLAKQTKPEQVVRLMLQTFQQRVTPELRARAEGMGWTLHQWVTLASLIEKETGLPAERPMIAQVFLSRLQKGMLLQTDPAVIYGINQFDGNLTKQHLLTDGPYNTYLRPGLPPGPIASPGLEALRAVLQPAPTQYLYFVAKGDGSHHFSSNLADHNRAVLFFQKKQGLAPP